MSHAELFANTLRYRDGGDVVTIVMLPDGRAGEVLTEYATYATVRAWDQSAGTDYSYEYLQPWEERAEDLGLQPA